MRKISARLPYKGKSSRCFFILAGSGALIVAVDQADVAQGLDLLIAEIIGAFAPLAGGKIADAALTVAVDQLQGAGGVDQRKIPKRYKPGCTHRFPYK